MNRDIRKFILETEAISRKAKERTMYDKDVVIEKFLTGDFIKWVPVWGSDKLKVIKEYGKESYFLTWEGIKIAYRVNVDRIYVLDEPDELSLKLITNRIKRLASKLGIKIIVTKVLKRKAGEFRINDVVKIVSGSDAGKQGVVIDRRMLPGSMLKGEVDWDVSIPVKFTDGGFGVVDTDNLSRLT